MFRQGGATIKISSIQYVGNMDFVLESTIDRNDIEQYNKKGLGVLFRVMAKEFNDFVFESKS